MKGKLLLAGLVLLGGCARVPDFMVEGRLPHFGDEGDAPSSRMAQGPAEKSVATASAEASKPAPSARAVAQAQAPAPAAKPAPNPAPVKSMAMIENAHGREASGPAAPPAAAPPAPVVATAPIVGGFQPASDKAAVEMAASFAVHESPGYVLKSVKWARTQIVAGVNYDMCLKVRTPGHESSWVHQRLVRARVYQALDQHMELSSWQEVETCD